MEYEWDLAKDRENRRKHGIGFEATADFDWETALVIPDDRFDYGESRLLAIGLIKGRLASLAFTTRGNRIRTISLRSASRKERNLYDESRQRP